MANDPWALAEVQDDSFENVEPDNLTPIEVEDFNGDPWALAEVQDSSFEGDEQGVGEDEESVGNGKLLLAGGARATLGLSESVFRTPDAVARFGSLMNKVGSQNTPFANPVAAWVTKIVGKGVEKTAGLIAEGPEGGLGGTSDIADRISASNKMLPEMFPAFEELDRKGVKATDAVDHALQGEFSKLGDVVTDPGAWAAFTGEAIPTLYAAWKSGGSIPFMAWMEGMDQANSAAEFEKRTGSKISDEEFAAAVSVSAVVNSFLEKIGLDAVTKGRGSILTRMAAGSQVEGLTEVTQELVQNASGGIYDGERKLTEGLLQAYMGGTSAGGAMAGATGVADGLPVAPGLGKGKKKPESNDSDLPPYDPPPGSPAAKDVADSKDTIDLSDADNTDQYFKIEPAAEAEPTARFVYMPTDTQKKGALGEVRALDESTFLNYVRPFLVEGHANTLEEYHAKHPEATHIRLSKREEEPWRVEDVGPEEKVSSFEGKEIQPFVRMVDSFDAPEAQTWLHQQRKSVQPKEGALSIETDDILTAIAKMGGISTEEAISHGFDSEELKTRGHGIKRLFTKNGKGFDRMAEALFEMGYPVVDESGNYTENVLLEAVWDSLRGDEIRHDAGLEAKMEAEARDHEQNYRYETEPTKPEIPEFYDKPVKSEEEIIALYESLESVGEQAVEENLFQDYPEDFDQQAKNLADLAALASKYVDQDFVEDALMAGNDAQAAQELWAFINQGRSAENQQSPLTPESQDSVSPVDTAPSLTQKQSALSTQETEPDAETEARTESPQSSSPLDTGETKSNGGKQEASEREIEPESNSTQPTQEQIEEFTIDEKAFHEEIDEFERIFEEPPKGEPTIDVRAKKEGFIPLEEAQARINQWRKDAQEQGSGKGYNSENFKRTILSLFDYTGNWARPYAEAGYNVLTFDIQNGQDVNDFSVEYFNENYDFGEVYGILAACPCTDFASSGARWFAEKDKDGRTKASVDLVHQTLRTIEYFRPKFWVLENPVGRIGKLTDLPKWRTGFQPHNFGHPYTKKTMLWGQFNAKDIPIANVEPTEGSKMHNVAPGPERANIRSETPEGFSYAFFKGNNFKDADPVERTVLDFPDAAGAVRQAFKAGVSEERIREIGKATYENFEPEKMVESLIAEVTPKGKKGNKDGSKIIPRNQKEVDQAANEAATSPKNDLPQPTKAQKEANGEGNYKLGDPVKLQGVTWRVENPKDSYRFDFDEDTWAAVSGENKVLDLLRSGKVPEAFKTAKDHLSTITKGTEDYSDAKQVVDSSWFNKMPAHYSRAVGVEAFDGDALDAFIGPNSADQSLPVFVVNTVRFNDSKTFDEHKVMIGYKDEASALSDFKKSYDNGVAEKILLKGNSIVELSPKDFSQWVKDEGPLQGELKAGSFGETAIKNAVLEVASKLSLVDIEVLDSLSSMPDSSAKTTIEEMKGDQPRGFGSLSDNKVYLFSDKINDPQDGVALLLHESVAHHGLQALFPKKASVEKDRAVVRRQLSKIGVTDKWSDKDIDQLIAQDAKKITGKPIDEVVLSEEVEVEETGETFVVESKANVLLRQHDKRVNVIKSLKECVS